MKQIIIDEKEIKEVVIAGLREKIATRYTYEAVDKIVIEVMQEENSRDNLKKFIRECLSFVKGDKAFEKMVKEEFQHKVAKSMVGKLEGTVERAVDAIRQDQTLRAEMILAIEKIINKK
jgi:hypothetical protein